MVSQITDNLYTIPVPLPGNPLKNLNVYVFTGSRNLLVDTGFRQEACREALLAGLAQLGISMDNTDIFLTHLHSDHTGLAPELAVPGTNVYIGSRDLSHMPGGSSTFSWAETDARFAQEGFPWPLLRELTHKNPAQALSPVPYDGYLPVEDGDVFSYGGHQLQALWTPGHTPGHMCLFEPATGICILGDHVLFDITPNITRWHGIPDSLGDYLQALRRIDALAVTLPLPAHRAVHGDFHSRCQALQTHHRQRCQEVLHILSGSKAETAWDIAAKMRWNIRCRGWEDFPTPQKWFAVGEALAHLDYLMALGLVGRTLKQGLYRYFLTAPKGLSNEVQESPASPQARPFQPS